MTKTLTQEACIAAAQELLARRKTNIKGDLLAQAIRPTNLDDALAIQFATVQESGKEIGGWKCLVPLNPEQMVVAPVLEGTVQQAETCLVESTEPGKTLIEPEIAFVLGKDLPARDSDYSESEIDDAIASCHMALELMQRRYLPDDNRVFFDNLADCLFNQGIFVGPEITKEQAYQAGTIDITFETVDEKGQTTTTEYEGKHPNLSAHKPVYWLINFMRERGISFKKGQAIITGSYAGAIEVPINTMGVTYKGLGEYKVTFKPV
ncbi:MAG: hydratase [Psychromonas sp.]